MTRSEIIEDVELLSIFQKGLDNLSFFSENKWKMSRWGSLLRIIRLFIISISILRRRRIGSDTIKLIWQPLHTTILEGKDGKTIVFENVHIKNKDNFFINYIPYGKSLKCFFSLPRCIRDKGLCYEWLTFHLLYAFFKENGINKIYVAGHYDRNATWLSYISNREKIEYVISQHGTCRYISIPHNIPATTVEYFSDNDKERMSSFILNPEKTKFVKKGYQCTLDLIKGDFDIPTLAIASQPGFEDLILEIISNIILLKLGVDIIIYSHPADRFKNQSISIEGKIIPIEKKKRFSDIFLLVILRSTISYDYLASKNYAGKILCYRFENMDSPLYDNKKIIAKYPNEFYSTLKEIVEENK